MFSAAIDMDGLLVDSERAIMNTWIAVALELGTALSPTDYLRIVGRASAECELILTELLGGAATFREALARVRQLLSRPSVDPVFPLKPGARALLTELSRAGVPCAVASSSPVEEIRSRLGRVSVLQFLGRSQAEMKRIAGNRIRRFTHWRPIGSVCRKMRVLRLKIAIMQRKPPLGQV